MDSIIKDVVFAWRTLQKNIGFTTVAIITIALGVGACTAGASCTTNPTICKNGTTSCATGAMTCIDGGNKAGGTSCGTNMVCNGSGSCIACTGGVMAVMGMATVGTIASFITYARQFGRPLTELAQLYNALDDYRRLADALIDAAPRR